MDALGRVRRRLQPCPHFGNVEWSDSRVGNTRSKEHGRIARAVPNGLITVDALERTIACQLRNRSPFRFLSVAILLSDVAQRIRPAYAIDNRCEKIGPPGHLLAPRDTGRSY